MKSILSQTLLFALVLTTQIAVNTFGMENERAKKSTHKHRKKRHHQIKLPYDVQGKIVTTLLDLYRNEFDQAAGLIRILTDRNPYHQKTSKFLNGILYWIYHTRPIQKYIDFNGTSKEGDTILRHTTEIAIENAYYDNQLRSNSFNLTQYLLEHNASPNIRKNNDKTAFWYCMYETTRFPYSNYNAAEFVKDLVLLFLDKHANNFASHDTFIHYLARHQNFELIGDLLLYINIKAVMNKQDRWGATPACCAAQVMNIPCLHFLVAAGANFTIKQNEKTPLEWALETQKRHMKRTSPVLIRRMNYVVDLLQNVTPKNNQSSLSMLEES